MLDFLFERVDLIASKKGQLLSLAEWLVTRAEEAEAKGSLADAQKGFRARKMAGDMAEYIQALDSLLDGLKTGLKKAGERMALDDLNVKLLSADAKMLQECAARAQEQDILATEKWIETRSKLAWMSLKYENETGKKPNFDEWALQRTA